uniref:NADH dehydrogenase [ubiquinone] 1 alpha subcomplex subunit 5 n=1 Tax=Gadus morhua TaxID=8049 RepID=A0A8C5AB62_GADMO
MAGLLKKTTGLVGLAVSKNPQERLRILYSKILASLQTMPQDAAYRRYTEQLVGERYDLVKTESDIEKLEKKINGGQIEEVIFQVSAHLFSCSVGLTPSPLLFCGVNPVTSPVLWG